MFQSVSQDAFSEGVISDHAIRTSFDGTFYDDILFEEPSSSGGSDLLYESPGPYTSDKSTSEESSLPSDLANDYLLNSASIFRRTPIEGPQTLVTPNFQYFDGLPTTPFTMASFGLSDSNFNNNLDVAELLDFQTFDEQAWASEIVIDPSQVYDDETGSEVIDTNRAFAQWSGPLRRRSPGHTMSFQPYPTPPVSPSPLSPSSNSPQRTKTSRSGHIPGIDRKTGLRTLVGRYPPLMRGGQFYCPHPHCHEDRGGRCWGTQNGYKYHLMWNCLQNPQSRRSKKCAAEGGLGGLLKGKGNGIVAICECGQPFKSENGYKMHLEKNKTTYGGRCVERTRRRMEENRSQDGQTQQGTDLSSTVPSGLEIGYEIGSGITDS